MLTVDIDSLRPNAFNTNRVSPENEQKLVNSLKKFGVYKPIICREVGDELEIIGGEHRWRAAKQIGLREVPIVNLGVVSEEKSRQLMLVDNGRWGEDDPLALSELLKEFGNPDEILNFLPMSSDELDAIFSTSSIDLDDLDSSTDDIDLDSLPSKKAQTHVMMRFKVPIEDSESLQKIIDTTMKSQGFTSDDSLTNAGHALVHLLTSKK